MGERTDVSMASQIHRPRRQVLQFLGGAVATSLLGCVRSAQQSSGIAAPSPVAARTTCVVRPQQSEGPYFTDTQLNRRDIRFDPASGVVSDGIPLRLILNVFQQQSDRCTPLRDAIVDVWHCDASGVYSDVRDRTANTVGQQYLRGFQVTNENGQVEFLTIYPGWYPGRAVHIHFKIRGSEPQPYEFTSQLYFADAVTDQVQAIAPYRDRATVRIRNGQDGLFQRGGEQLIVPVTDAPDEWVGVFDIGLDFNHVSFL